MTTNLNLDDLRFHTEVGTGYSKDAMLAKAADEIEKLTKERDTAIEAANAGSSNMAADWYEIKSLRNQLAAQQAVIEKLREALQIAIYALINDDIQLGWDVTRLQEALSDIPPLTLLREAEAKAMEECAGVCADIGATMAPLDCATSIRRLAEERRNQK